MGTKNKTETNKSMKMTHHRLIAVCLTMAATMTAMGQGRGLTDTSHSQHAVMNALPIDAVRWAGGFWGERFDVFSKTSVQSMWATWQSAEGKGFNNFLIASGEKRGEHHGPPFHDGDMYKWLEAVASVYAITKDPELASIMDRFIGCVVKSQRPDGYIHTPVVIAELNKRLAQESSGDNDNTDDTDADDEAEQFGPTIPERTDIYAYSANVTKDYAAADARQDFEGTFYPLDEVLYLTSNKPRVELNDDESDFDKSNLVVYGLRRDGVILQSDNWGEFDGVAYPRNDSDLVFEKMDAGIEEDPIAGAVYDTPVPMNLLSLANENFANIDFDLIRDPDDQDVRLVNIIYTDAYTGGQPDTDIDPYAIPPTPPPTPRPPLPPIPEIIETVIEGPITFVKNHFGYVVMLAACSAGLVFVLKRRKQS